MRSSASTGLNPRALAWFTNPGVMLVIAQTDDLLEREVLQAEGPSCRRCKSADTP